MNSKPLVESKEFWLNLVSFVLIILTLPEFIALIPEVALKYIALITTIGNIALRYFFTSKPISGVFK